jgi:hypothetical protein
MIVHLDLFVLPRLLDAVSDRELRLLMALLALAPSGELVGHERQLARRAGLDSVATLRMLAAGLTEQRQGWTGPLLAQDTVGGKRRLRVAMPGLLVVHPDRRAAASDRTSTATAGAPVRARDLAARRDRQAQLLLEAAGERVAGLIDAWLGHLVELRRKAGQPSAELTSAEELVQLEVALEISQRHGADVLAAALAAAVSGLREASAAPERYLAAIADRLARSGRERRAPSVMAEEELF